MKRFKLALWTAALFVIHTAVNRYVNIYDAVPDIFLAFSISYAIFENDFLYITGMAVVCGLMSSALSAHSFTANIIVFVISAALSYGGNKKFKTVPPAVKAVAFSAAATAFGGALLCLADSAEFSQTVLFEYLLPNVIINSVYAAVIYPVIKKTIRLDKMHSSLLIP